MLGRRLLPGTAVLLCCTLGLWIWLAPAETRLGPLLKLVDVHGALVWAGLLAFAFAGLLGLMALICRTATWRRGAAAAGTAALVTWLAYCLSAMVVT